MRKTLMILSVAALGMGTLSPQANAIGCLSGGAAGAVAGHMAGHGILGALGGCIAGHQWHKHQVKKQNLQNTQTYDEQRRKTDPNYKSPWQ